MPQKSLAYQYAEKLVEKDLAFAREALAEHYVAKKMTAKSNATKQAEHKARKVAAGLKRVELWVKPEHEAKVRAYVRRLTK